MSTADLVGFALPVLAPDNIGAKKLTELIQTPSGCTHFLSARAHLNTEYWVTVSPQSPCRQWLMAASTWAVWISTVWPCLPELLWEWMYRELLKRQSKSFSIWPSGAMCRPHAFVRLHQVHVHRLGVEAQPISTEKRTVPHPLPELSNNPTISLTRPSDHSSWKRKRTRSRLESSSIANRKRWGGRLQVMQESVTVHRNADSIPVDGDRV